MQPFTSPRGDPPARRAPATAHEAVPAALRAELATAAPLLAPSIDLAEGFRDPTGLAAQSALAHMCDAA